MLKLVRPGPTDWKDTPGIDAASVAMSGTPRPISSSPVCAVILIGVSCSVVSRFVAVTTISPKVSELGGASSAVRSTRQPAGRQHGQACDTSGVHELGGLH